MDRANDSSGAARTWLVWGGETRFEVDPDSLDRFGLTLLDVAQSNKRVVGASGVRYESDTFKILDASALEIRHEGAVMTGVGGGALQHAGGLRFGKDGRVIDLRGFSLRASAGSQLGLDIVDANGTVWFTADHAHYGFEHDRPDVFSMRHMNLLGARAFAEFVGDASAEGYPVGRIFFSTYAPSAKADFDAIKGACAAPWPAPGGADIQLIRHSSDQVTAKRCSLPPTPGGGACTSGTTTGQVVFAPDSSLRNVGETAVSWIGKFQGTCSGDHAGCPYNADQHPFLIWNMYRVDVDGRIKQIGASGVKHAFFTVNSNCSCAGGDIIWPACEDTYSTGNNDSSGDLGPRSEIVPATAQWGRCGSVYDPTCTGSETGSGATNTYQFRLNATESEMLPPVSTGATYFFEYWYVVRDDGNIYNTMGYRKVAPSKSGSTWSISLPTNDPILGATDFANGPVINRWIDPTTPPANSTNTELSNTLGHARIATKVTDLGNGQWRYEYAVMNLDYSHAEIDPAHKTEPNLKVLSNHGFDRFGVSLPVGVTATDVRFDDIDTNAANDWTSTVASDEIVWDAPAGNTIDWGTLYHFEFTANAPPSAINVEVRGVATTTETAIPYSVAALGPVPNNDIIFADNFDPPVVGASAHR